MSAAVRTAPRPGAPASSRAWGWVAHLEGGGATPWSHWRERAEGDAPAAGRFLPGAQQLELVRRLNEAGRPDPTLVRRVLTAAAVGRGRHDLALTGAGTPEAFAPDPVDPADLAPDDLLRVAVGLLAEDLARPDSSAVSRGIPTATAQTNRRTRRLRTRYRLVGDPELTGPRRAALIADGRPPGGKGAAVLVLGTDLATMLGHAWVAGALAEGGPSWPDHLAAWRRRGGVPRRIDLPAVADRWRRHPATGSLDVVLDLDAVPALLRLRGGPALGPGRPVSVPAGELARRTAIALGLLVPADQRERVLETALRPRLVGAAGPPPVVPAEHRGWVGERAIRMRDQLARAGHPVVGDLDSLVPTWDQPEPGGADVDAAALDLALDLLLTTPQAGPS